MRTVVFRVVPVVVLALCAGACARDPYVAPTAVITSGNWKIERQTDRITGVPVASALLTANTGSNTAEPFAHLATIQLLCFKGAPVVRIAFDFKVGSTKNSALGYRFDEKPGHEIEARFVQDYKTVVIEDKPTVVQFIDEMKTSSGLYLRIRSLNAGRSSAEFKVDGAPAAIDTALATCPAVMPPEPQQAAPAPRRRSA